MASPPARDALVRRLRLAYSGELAAARAYAGHWRSIRGPKRAGQREAIQRIMREELEHRAEVGQMLAGLGHRPSRLRDAAMWCIGTAIAASCFVGGWYVPMYGAGRIERRNIWEYEDAVRAMAEVEWDHERFFHDQVRGHWLHARFGGWPEPGPREEIRASFLRGEPALKFDAAAPARPAVAV
jgi:rubrerythrin